MQSVSITTDVMSSNRTQGEVYNITICDKVCQWFVAGLWFCQGTPVSSTNKTDRHNINEIFLKMALKHHNQPTNQ
jgi:hypothetical protein